MVTICLGFMLPLYHPLQVAEEAAVIDNLSIRRLRDPPYRGSLALHRSGRNPQTCLDGQALLAQRTSLLVHRCDHHPDFRSESDFTTTNCFRHAVAGSPQECIDRLAVYGRDYDVDYVIMRFRLPAGPERERVLDCIRLFGEEVLPRAQE